MRDRQAVPVTLVTPGIQPKYASVRWEHGYMSPAYVGCTAGRLTEVDMAAFASSVAYVYLGTAGCIQQ
jgi:hypothetical protein